MAANYGTCSCHADVHPFTAECIGWRDEYPYRCRSCGRLEDDCSRDPCAGVIQDREAVMPVAVREEVGIETYVNDDPDDPNPGIIVDSTANRGRALTSAQARALATELLSRADYFDDLTERRQS